MFKYTRWKGTLQCEPQMYYIPCFVPENRLEDEILSTLNTKWDDTQLRFKSERCPWEKRKVKDMLISSWCVTFFLLQRSAVR